MITVTDKAAKKIKTLLGAEGNAESGLRMGVTGGGCSGVSVRAGVRRQPGRTRPGHRIQWRRSVHRSQEQPLSKRRHVKFRRRTDGVRFPGRKSECSNDLWLWRVFQLLNLVGRRTFPSTSDNLATTPVGPRVLEAMVAPSPSAMFRARVTVRIVPPGDARFCHGLAEVPPQPVRHRQ